MKLELYNLPPYGHEISENAQKVKKSNKIWTI